MTLQKNIQTCYLVGIFCMINTYIIYLYIYIIYTIYMYSYVICIIYIHLYIVKWFIETNNDDASATVSV